MALIPDIPRLLGKPICFHGNTVLIAFCVWLLRGVPGSYRFPGYHVLNKLWNPLKHGRPDLAIHNRFATKYRSFVTSNGQLSILVPRQKCSQRHISEDCGKIFPERWRLTSANWTHRALDSSRRLHSYHTGHYTWPTCPGPSFAIQVWFSPSIWGFTGSGMLQD